jgi:tetratricopeptide (TPR) repeat protein
MLKRLLILALLTISLNGCTIYYTTFSGTYYSSYLQKAEALRDKGKYLEAIEAYETHIKFRNKSKKKLEGETPSFYYLMIGDIYLEMDQPEKAEQAYKTALKAEKNIPLCAERLRRLGKYYEQKGDIKQAIEAVRSNRELDPLLFDLEIDRLHKALVEKEREERKD